MHIYNSRMSFLTQCNLVSRPFIICYKTSIQSYHIFKLLCVTFCLAVYEKPHEEKKNSNGSSSTRRQRFLNCSYACFQFSAMLKYNNCSCKEPKKKTVTLCEIFPSHSKCEHSDYRFSTFVQRR